MNIHPMSNLWLQDFVLFETNKNTANNFGWTWHRHRVFKTSEKFEFCVSRTIQWFCGNKLISSQRNSFIFNRSFHFASRWNKPKVCRFSFAVTMSQIHYNKSNPIRNYTTPNKMDDFWLVFLLLLFFNAVNPGQNRADDLDLTLQFPPHIEDVYW